MGLLDVLGLKPRAASTGAPPAQGAAPQAAVKLRSGPSATPASAPAASAEQITFATARAIVQAIVVVLNGHAQRAAVQAQIAQTTAKLVEADAHAAKAEWPAAMAAVAAAKVLADAAKKAADDRSAYAAKLASVMAQISALTDVETPAKIASYNVIVNTANAQAAANNVATALITLDGVYAKVKLTRTQTLNWLKAKLASIVAMGPAIQAFAAAEIASANTLIATGTAALAAEEWSQCISSSFAAIDVLASGERMVLRRKDYETARTKAVAAIASVKADAAVSDRGPGFDALLAQADALASHGSMKFEDGTVILADLSRRCTAWLALSATIASHTTNRAAADTEIAALDKHAAAAKVADVRGAVGKLLVDAAKFAALGKAGTNPEANWPAALAAVLRARADLAEAKKLADGLGNVAGAEAAAGNPGDVATMKTALKALQADAAAAAAAPFAAEAAAEFKTFTEQSTKADAALTKNDGKSAAKPMAQAAQALTKAKAIQSAHGQYASTLATVEAQLKLLQALPRAVAIKAKIDAVVKALADAAAKDKAKKGTEALAALRLGADAVLVARQADADREKFDNLAAPVATRVAALADPKARKSLEGAMADAKKLADAFRFDDAARALKQVEVRLDEIKLNAAASANPTDPAIATLAAQMVANGGTKNVDAMVKAASDPKIIALLAKGRFGVDFQLDASAPAGREVTAMKALCETFAKVPKDVKAQTSITSYSHTDASDPRAVSGAYSSDATVTLTGRPGIAKQGFGKDLKGTDVNGNTVSQLPDKIDPDCKAKGGEAELLSFTALHEVGHGVDDANTFMARNGAQEKYGGWIEYGNGVQPIADAAGTHFKFYTTPEQKKYVLDTLLHKPTLPPPEPPAPPVVDWAGRKADFDAWFARAIADHVYESEPDCVLLTIDGRIYQEAYARQWVSYLASARSKGLTGYQFRAPGEWFAELYAGYHAKKLSDKHPAVEWLKKL